MNTSVRNIELTQKEFNYLNGSEFLSPHLLACLRRAQWRSDTVATVELAHAIAEEFRTAFTEQLAKVGFDKAYEPTAHGRLLEDLIDRFSDRLPGERTEGIQATN